MSGIRGKRQAAVAEEILAVDFSRPSGTTALPTCRPNVETLGYCRSSLQDGTGVASDSRPPFPVLQRTGRSLPLALGRAGQQAFGLESLRPVLVAEGVLNRFFA